MARYPDYIMPWNQHGPRITPYSRIDLDGHPALHEALDTMDVELEQAVLVIRGKHKGQDVEFQIGNLRTQGPDNGMVVIHRAEHTDLYGDHMRVRTLVHDEYRLLLDCELEPDKNGHAFTIRMHEEQG